MKEENNNLTDEQQKISETLNELDELSKNPDADLSEIKQKIEKLKDGTEVLKGEFEGENEEEGEKELTLKEKKGLYRFVNGLKYYTPVSDELIEELDEEDSLAKENNVEGVWDKMVKKSNLMFKNMNYFPKKKFNKDYKKKRQHRNKMAKASRRNNR